MKKFVQMLNEAGFAVCVAFAIVLAFFLMTSDVVLGIVFRTTFSEVFAKLARKRKNLVPCAGQLRDCQKQFEQQTEWIS